MSESARVESIDSIKEFRVYLAKFRELARLAVGDAESELHRVQNWLETEQPNYWTGQIRKRQEILSRAEEMYRQKKLFKDSTGQTPSAVDEQKAVMVAKKNLADAQEKLKNVQGWNRKLQKEMVLYQGAVAPFANQVSAGIPHAIAFLGGTVESLEKYVGITAEMAGELGGAEVVGAGAGAETGGASMSRSADEMAPVEALKPVDPAALRAAVPMDNALGDPVPLALVSILSGEVRPEQRIRAAELPMDGGAEADETVILSASASSAERVFLVRRPPGGKYAWFIGAVDAAQDTVYNKARVDQLTASRPDFGDLLKMVSETIVVFDGGGLYGVYNSNNDNILPPPLEDESKEKKAE
jgi:hypothetical protein